MKYIVGIDKKTVKTFFFGVTVAKQQNWPQA